MALQKMSSNAAFESKLEQRLRRANILSESQLEMAREHQTSAAIGFMEALVELDLLSACEVEHIVNLMNEIRSVKLEELQVDLDAVKHVPRHTALTCKCIPIRRSGNVLVVAVSGSNTESVFKELRAVTDYEIVLLMANPDALEHALFIYYGKDDVQAELDQNVLSGAHLSINSWTIQPAWNSTFETLIDHDGIVRAKEVAKQIASSAGGAFNLPVIFSGSNETGKTHLLTAIRNYCSEKEPALHGILCTGKQLSSLVADYTLAGKLDALRYELRACSFLLIDDFAGAWGNETIERELASTISNLRTNAASVVAAMTDEEYIAGPTTSILRETIKQGSEVHLRLPDQEAMSRIIASRVDARQKKNDGVKETWLLNDDNSWSQIQRQVMLKHV